KGSNIGVIFAEGIVWGGKVNDGQSPLVRVNGNTYGTGCQSVFNPPRVFKVRPDYQTGSLADDAANFNNIALGQVSQGDIDALRAQYATDWNEWPADQGAPYEDVNNDGKYEADTDIPGIPGAAQTLFVQYTDALSAANYGSQPIGLQISETYWAYAYTGALGNVIYKKVNMVYKGTAKSSANSTIDSMYIVQWADPDVGTSSDDFAGCDTTLNLGYAYTAQSQDATYQAAGYGPPAIGYDFLQGVSQYTGNPNDSAIVNVKWRKGYKYINPKPMSSFIYFAAGGNWSDPSFDYTGTLEFYNLMRGYLPEPHFPSAAAFPEAVSDVTPYGTYLLAGDPTQPLSATNKLDGNTAQKGDSPGDRRIMVVNGPITMHLGDTAEVVLAMVGGLASPQQNNIDAVTIMKNNDKTAQIVFDQLFKLPSISPPNVKVEQLDQKIVLDWGNDQASIKKIENFSSQNYKFEGYEVYQLPSPSASLSDGVNLGTFDLVDGITTIVDTVEEAGVLLGKVVVAGQDKGVQRFLTITKDAFKGNQPLRNGQEYYFAVVPYAFNPAPLLPFHALQSAVIIKVAVPQQPFGIQPGSTVGDTLLTKHTTGQSDGSVFGLVVEPTKTTGNSYKVSFNADNEGNTTWSLTNTSNGTVDVSGIANQSGDNAYPIVDGIMIKVIGPPEAVKSWSSTGTRWVSGYSGAGGDPNNFFGGLLIGKNFFGSDLPASDYVPVELDWTGGASALPPSDANGWSQGAVYRRDKGYAYEGIGWLPFKAYDISDPNNPKQINASFVEDSVNGSANLQWDMGWNGTSFADNGGREYLFINNTPYDPTHYNADVDGTYNDVLYAIWPIARGDHPYLEAPWTMTIEPNYINLPSDVFTFTAPSVTKDAALQKVDAEKVNVFPNPYYGFQSRETSRDAKYVTFSHLPDKATIRIFDLSGVLVKTINKNDQTQFTTWNLQNDNGYPVASGVYVVYVDMPTLGATKVLKLALVQEEQILKVY
ncbi:MAG: T9SS type A sorting domain-containing protein, partial [Ignavibacteriaceae bacterium]